MTTPEQAEALQANMKVASDFLSKAGVAFLCGGRVLIGTIKNPKEWPGVPEAVFINIHGDSMLCLDPFQAELLVTVVEKTLEDPGMARNPVGKAVSKFVEALRKTIPTCERAENSPPSILSDAPGTPLH